MRKVHLLGYPLRRHADLRAKAFKRCTYTESVDQRVHLHLRIPRLHQGQRHVSAASSRHLHLLIDPGGGTIKAACQIAQSNRERSVRPQVFQDAAGCVPKLDEVLGELLKAADGSALAAAREDSGCA